jgi:hypothetical protein
MSTFADMSIDLDIIYFANARLFLDRSAQSSVDSILWSCYDWVCYDYKFESTEVRAIAI